MAMTDAQKIFFASLDLSDDQMDQIIENETLFENEAPADQTELQKQIDKLTGDLTESKKMYRERFFSTDPEDQQKGKGEPDNLNNDSDEDPEKLLDDVLGELK